MPCFQLGQVTLNVGFIQRQNGLSSHDLLTLTHKDFLDASAALVLNQFVLAITYERAWRDHRRGQWKEAGPQHEHDQQGADRPEPKSNDRAAIGLGAGPPMDIVVNRLTHVDYPASTRIWPLRLGLEAFSA